MEFHVRVRNTHILCVNLRSTFCSSSQVSLGSKAKAVNLRGKHHRRSKRAPQEVAVPFPLYWQHNLSTPNKRLIHDQRALFMPFCIWTMLRTCLSVCSNKCLRRHYWRCTIEYYQQHLNLTKPINHLRWHRRTPSLWVAHAGTCCAVKFEHCIVGLISLRWSEKSKRIDKIVLDLERGGRAHGAWFRLLRHMILLLLSLKSEVKVRYIYIKSITKMHLRYRYFNARKMRLAARWYSTQP